MFKYLWNGRLSNDVSKNVRASVAVIVLALLMNWAEACIESVTHFTSL